MKNTTDFEEEGPVWTACLQFSSTWKYNRETHLLYIDCVKVFIRLREKNYGK
jgi:hypothetical protein